MTDTIFAQATAHGRAGVAVIRVSGPECGAISSALLNQPWEQRQHRLATLGVLREPGTEAVIDQVLSLSFQAPHSFTGEDVLELQCHGSLGVVSWILDVLASLNYVREAGAGEFSRRALANGKMSILETEQLRDMLDADTQFIASMTRDLSGSKLEADVLSWKQALIAALAKVEAQIDFVDEGDVDSSLDFMPEIEAIKARISEALAAGDWFERHRDGYLVAVAGMPNVGKSSLMNALAGREVAIVSDQQGTTRDAIEISLTIDGVPVRLVDTAGVRETEDTIEQQGIKRTREVTQRADIVLSLCDGRGYVELETSPQSSIIEVQTKADLRQVDADEKAVWVSTNSAEGLAQLRATLKKELGQLVALRPVRPGLTTARQQKLAKSALALLNSINEALSMELVAEELRSTISALSALTGGYDVEEMLDELFAGFCIGK